MRRLALLLALLLVAPAAVAHTPTAAEVTGYLSSEAVKRDDGVVRAATDPKLTRLLVIEVGPAWYARSEADRRKLATSWQALWQHVDAKGAVAILDTATAAPVVRFRAAGTVEIVTPPKARPD